MLAAGKGKTDERVRDCRAHPVDRSVRISLSRLLETAGYRARSFDSAERFLEEQDSDAPGCLLLDIGLPGMSGLELQRLLVGLPNARPVVFLTGTGDIPASVQAMKAGAVDFLTKPIDDVRLLAAVEQALRLDAQQRQERAIHSSIDQHVDSLSWRERQVMELVICGRLNRQIGVDLGIKEKTVKVHRKRVMEKMGVRSVANLVQLVIRAGVKSRDIDAAASNSTQVANGARLSINQLPTATTPT